MSSISMKEVQKKKMMLNFGIHDIHKNAFDSCNLFYPNVIYYTWMSNPVDMYMYIYIDGFNT